MFAVLEVALVIVGYLLLFGAAVSDYFFFNGAILRHSSLKPSYYSLYSITAKRSML